MKLLYIFVSVACFLVTGYLFTNNFSFDNSGFSNFLITALFITLLFILAVGGIAAMIALKKKHQDKDMMTIRQYYNYRSAR